MNMNNECKWGLTGQRCTRPQRQKLKLDPGNISFWSNVWIKVERRGEQECRGRLTVFSKFPGDTI